MHRNAETFARTPDLTPMLDVVFIMLIFFIITATFVKEQGLGVSPPEPAQVPPPINIENILVRIDGNNQLIVQNRHTDIRGIQPSLIRLHAMHPQAKLIVDPHPLSDTETLIRVIDYVRLAGIDDFALAAI